MRPNTQSEAKGKDYNQIDNLQSDRRRGAMALSRRLGRHVYLLFLLSGAVLWKLEFRQDIGDFLVTNDEDDDRPRLDTLIDRRTNNLTAPVDWLLDFIIAGFPKCATTSIMATLFGHNQTQMYNEELHELRLGHITDLVELIYNLPPGKQYKRGYKAPNEVTNPQSLWQIRKYFPRAKLIIGVRHPVWWFQSWFNFKSARHKMKWSIDKFLATRQFPPMVEYHKNLAQLGKTNVMNDARERALLGHSFPRKVPPNELPLMQAMGMELIQIPEEGHNSTRTIAPIQRAENPVFLYSDLQLKNPRTSKALLTALQSFLGLDQPLLQILSVNTADTQTNETQINICDDEYDTLRQELVRLGSDMADWILNYFYMLPDVTVVSPGLFREQLLDWKHDPCVRS